MRLNGRRIIVSGAASGIGLAVCKRFVSEGAAVAMIDIDASGLYEAAGRLAASANPPARVLSRAIDVSEEKAVNRAVELLAGSLQGLDGLVNAAGVDLACSIEETSTSSWDRLLSINLRGPFLLCRAALPYLRSSGKATIVNIASAAALKPVAGRTGYCASKAGLVMLGKALAMEAAPEVRVNSVCPGAIDTPLLRGSYENDENPGAVLQAITDRYLMRRIGDVDEVADAVLYLTSDESTFVTGTALAVDGGRTFH